MGRTTGRRQHEIGAAVRNARMARGITQDELAQALGVDRVTISRYEGGKRAIGIPTLLDVSAYLRIPVTLLLPRPNPEDALESLHIEQGLSDEVRAIAAHLCRQPDLIATVKAVIASASANRDCAEKSYGSDTNEDNR